jgi:cob(I)alamin adenosyltransferase
MGRIKVVKSNNSDNLKKIEKKIKNISKDISSLEQEISDLLKIEDIKEENVYKLSKKNSQSIDDKIKVLKNSVILCAAFAILGLSLSVFVLFYSFVY